MVRGGGHGVAGNPLADDAVADPTTSEANVAWARDAVDVLEPFSSGGGYLNFPGLFEEGVELLRASHGAANYDRLVALKQKYDPTGLVAGRAG
jgi:FAD/FMN-containing dehydrogenase